MSSLCSSNVSMRRGEPCVRRIPMAFFCILAESKDYSIDRHLNDCTQKLGNMIPAAASGIQKSEYSNLQVAVGYYAFFSSG
ncbi:hypothetical protein ABZP36_030359 [Zizania latifolia]